MTREHPGRDNPLARRRPAIGGQVEDYTPRRRPEPDEYPSDEDIERFSGVTAPCSNCGAELYDDVALCFNCGHAVGDPAGSRPIPRWAIIAAALALLAFLFTMIR